MPITGSNKTEYQRNYMRRKRSNKEKGLTSGLTEYPAILKALVNPDKRKMLEYISEELNKKGLGSKVWYGVGGPDFEVISELLEVTA